MNTKDYASLRYPIELLEEPGEGFVAHHPDLPGCIAQGTTVQEAYDALAVARELWIETRLEDGLPIPEPKSPDAEYSGRFLLRLPKSLHGELARLASREGTSINQYAVHLLSAGVSAASAVGQMKEQLREVFESCLASFVSARRQEPSSAGAGWRLYSAKMLTTRSLVSKISSYEIFTDASPEPESQNVGLASTLAGKEVVARA